LSKHVEV